jgi:uncharacterized protein YlzI (FlbEa/FlbD family)
MTLIVTSIGARFLVKESIDDITQAIKDKDICIFTLTTDQLVAINSKHIVFFQ